LLAGKGEGKWGGRKAEESKGLQKPQLTNSPLPNSPPALLTLLKLHRLCPHVFDSLEVFLDGSIRCGADVLKALCLGATAVGIGRPFLYALSYGQQGVEHFIDAMRDELEAAMLWLTLRTWRSVIWGW
jgi:L-lactate dehydrogenase (cytochrome)